MEKGLLVIWYPLAVSVILCVFIGLIIRRLLSKKRQVITQNNHPTSFFGSTRTQHVIGVLTPLANSTANYLAQGLLNQLDSSPHAGYQIKNFHGNNDRVLLFNKAVEALESCSVVVPFGLTCTNIAYEAARHTQSSTPIVFSGIKATHIPLLRRQNPQRKLIGIISQRDYFTQINQLRAIKPQLKNVLILYRQQLEWLVAEANDICRYLGTLDVNAKTHLLPHTNHIDNQLGTIKESFDTILLMPHTLNAKGLHELITFCNIKGITLCANELDAVTLGAAIGFGGQEITIGSRVGRTIRDILEIKKEPREDTIIEHVDDYQVHINFNTINQQDITLSPELLFLLNQGEVTHQATMQLDPKSTSHTQVAGARQSSSSPEKSNSSLNRLLPWARRIV